MSEEGGGRGETTRNRQKEKETDRQIEWVKNEGGIKTKFAMQLWILGNFFSLSYIYRTLINGLQNLINLFSDMMYVTLYHLFRSLINCFYNSIFISKGEQIYSYRE